jgi:ethanolamine utilization protein EutP (predicted NTPase)
MNILKTIGIHRWNMFFLFTTPYNTYITPKKTNYIQYLPKKIETTTNVLMNKILFSSSIIMFVTKVGKKNNIQMKHFHLIIDPNVTLKNKLIKNIMTTIFLNYYKLVQI